MTDMQAAYNVLRERGIAHFRACDVLAHRFKLDRGTVNRVVRRAQDEERRLARTT